MRLSTPPFRKCGHLVASCSHTGQHRTDVHTPDYTKTTPGCGHQKSLIFAAFTPLTTLTTPYFINNRMKWKIGMAGGVSERRPIWDEGVDTQGVDRGPRL
jgi:hypothetical protein